MEQAPRAIAGDERRRLAEARLGQLVLGKWRLHRLLAISGTAAIYEGAHRNGNRVAVKVLHGDLASTDEVRERFLAKAYAANRVAHPGVVSVRDEGTTDDGAVFLVMELLQGQTLAERLRPGGEPLSVGQVLELASQLCDVLVHAHDRGIVHGQIEPEKVFLTRDGRVRLLHFGATPAGSENPLLDRHRDLWSLGATMYLLLSGARAGDPGAWAAPTPSLGDVALLPRSVVAVVDRALALDADARFPDARSMQLAVRAAKDEPSSPDGRNVDVPPSLEPMALSLSTPRPRPPRKPHRASSPGSPGYVPHSGTPAYGSVRPVAATPLPGARPASRGALPLYIGFGFALGLAIVITARLNVHRAVSEPAVLPERAAAVLVPPPIPSGLPAPSASAARAASSVAPTKPPQIHE